MDGIGFEELVRVTGSHFCISISFVIFNFLHAGLVPHLELTIFVVGSRRPSGGGLTSMGAAG